VSEKIKFIYHDKLVYQITQEQECTRPRSAKHFLPEWYKKMEPYEKSKKNPTGKKLLIENMKSNASAKKCTPMLDAMISGYIIPLWSDVQVTQEKNENGRFYPQINWRISTDVFQLHGQSSRMIPAPYGYDNVVFKFCSWFRIQTPPGYSLIVSSPSNHNGLPFLAVPAIVDTDKSVIDNNFPCWIEEGFEGIVEKGTPIAQITPFKRTNWKSEFSEIDAEEYNLSLQKNFNSNILNNYIRNIWTKKNYE
jgi:hypothetical protein